MNYIILILFIIVLLIIYLFNKKEQFSNLDDDILLSKPNENIKIIEVDESPSDRIIPKNIFMTWYNKKLPEKMQLSVDITMSKNPEFKFYIYNDDDCINFLKKYFINDVVDAFDKLIPGAYKADLWRYCVLYKYGGIYQDIKFLPVGKFKYISLIDKEYYVRDIKFSGYGIYNALLICKPKNEILKKCINQIIQNTKTNFYGNSPLEPTGPLLMKKFIADNNNNVSLKLLVENENVFIVKNDVKILKGYSNYRNEQSKLSKKHYNYLYLIKNIYKK